MREYLHAEYAVVNFGTEEIQQQDKQWMQKNQGSGLDYIFCGFGSQRIEGLGDRNFLEITDFSKFRAPKKLEFDWLAKRMGSDSFTICGERI